jgi:hypothetical protein
VENGGHVAENGFMRISTLHKMFGAGEVGEGGVGAGEIRTGEIGAGKAGAEIA